MAVRCSDMMDTNYIFCLLLPLVWCALMTILMFLTPTWWGLMTLPLFLALIWWGLMKLLVVTCSDMMGTNSTLFFIELILWCVMTRLIFPCNYMRKTTDYFVDPCTDMMWYFDNFFCSFTCMLGTNAAYGSSLH